jgi:predicted SAM-dependent methyltransferase
MQNNQTKLHLGCGDVNLAGWVNIDLDAPTADLHLDLTGSLPFPTGSVSHIFCEHFIEHISRAEANRLLLECRRVLSDTGTIRITTPNLRFLVNAYLAHDKDEWGDLWQPDSLCLMINEGMRSWGHQFVYDADEIVRLLASSGFNSISFHQYRTSNDENLRELESRPFHNELIVEARIGNPGYLSVDREELQKIELQWSRGLEHSQVDRLRHFEQVALDQSINISALEKDISEHLNRIDGLQVALSKFQNSLYGKTISFLSKVKSFIKRA